jgi:hypothetical protein
VPGDVTSDRKPQIGSLLLAPSDSGARAPDVLCVFDEDEAEPGALFALVLNRPTEEPAQPLAFGLFDCGDDHAWWGGPTQEPLALVELAMKDHGDDAFRPSGEPRRYVTSRTGVWLPGRDHPPSTPTRVRVFFGCVWLSPGAVGLYQHEGIVHRATDDVLFDQAPSTLADRLRSGTFLD